jgi:hypothetical protein
VMISLPSSDRAQSPEWVTVRETVLKRDNYNLHQRTAFSERSTARTTGRMAAAQRSSPSWEIIR